MLRWAMPSAPARFRPPGWEDVHLTQGLTTRIIVTTPRGDLVLTGCYAVRSLPERRLLAVQPLLFGQARLCIGRPEMMALDAPWGGWDDQWEYPSVLAALAAMAQWEPEKDLEKDPEPAGWTRHQASGRRRPGGDPAQEYVRK